MGLHIQHGTRLKDIASSSAAARQTLERAGLDFCCEGTRTLAEACHAAGAAVDEIEEQLKTAPADTDPAGTLGELSSLVDRVLNEFHPRTKRLLADAAATAAKLAVTDPKAQPLADSIADLVAHASEEMREEEETLFARVRALAEARMGRGPYPSPPFRTIHDHGDRVRAGHKRTHDLIRLVRGHLARLAGATAGALAPRVDAAVASLTEQMHLENNEVLPRAQDLEPNCRHGGA